MRQGCGDIRFAIRGSRRSIRYGPSGQAWQPEESRVSRMVFIGRGLDKEVSNREPNLVRLAYTMTQTRMHLPQAQTAT